MADVARLDKYANWLIQNKDKKGTPDFDKVANAYRTLRSQDTPPANDNTEADTSFGGAIKYGIDNAGVTAGNAMISASELGADYLPESATGYLETKGNEFIDRNTQEIEEANYQRPDGADGIMKNLREGDYANAGKSLAYGAAESAPTVGVGVAASTGLALAGSTAPVTGSILMIGGTAYGTLNALGETRRENAEKGIDETATMQDLSTAIASGLIELLPVKGGGYTVKVLKEGIQEAGQEAVVMGNTAIKGGEYVTDEVFNRMGDAGLIGSTLSGAANTAISTVSKTGEVVFKSRQDLDPEVDQAAGDVARMLKEIASDNNYNLKDVENSSQKGANQALKAARDEIKLDVQTAADKIQDKIINDLDKRTQKKFKQIVANSNLKVGGSVTPQDIKFIKDLGIKYEPVQDMVNGLYKSNVLTEVYAAGLKGGFSKFTDVFNPLSDAGRSYGMAGRSIAGAVGGGALYGSGGYSLGIAAGGRAIDAVTGRRSKVKRFVKKNAKKSGLATPVGTQLPQSKADIEKENKAQLKANQVQYNAEQDNKKFDQARNRMRYNAELQNKKFDKSKSEDAVRKAEAKAKLDRENAKQVADAKEKALTARLNVLVNSERGAYTSDSPQGFIMQQTGLDYDGVELALSRLQDRYPNNPDVTEMISRYNQMFDSGYKETGKTLTPLKNMLVNTIENDPQLKKLKKKLAKSKKKKAEIDPRVQKGIDENKKRLSELKSSMEADMSISNRDKAILDKAFKELSKTLGTNPVAMAKMIIKDAKAEMDQPTKTNKYLKPYLDRVKAQQIKPKVNIQPQ
tara:strand:+ start:2477 stop:4879 length:2403 start_codon:yes stop_codon:yes gene_type:complete